MEAMLLGMIIWTAINFALVVFIARWIFKVNKIVGLLEEISRKMNGLQKEPVTVESLLAGDPDEKYKPRY
jgi:hypothetical protein